MVSQQQSSRLTKRLQVRFKGNVNKQKYIQLKYRIKQSRIHGTGIKEIGKKEIHRIFVSKECLRSWEAKSLANTLVAAEKSIFGFTTAEARNEELTVSKGTKKGWGQRVGVVT